MKNLVEKYLSKFEATVNLEHQGKVFSTCRKALNFEEVEELPFVFPEEANVPELDWPVFPYNDGFSDPVKMLLNQLRIPFIRNQLKDYSPLNIRCDYGTVIMPSIFGTDFKLTEKSMPWSLHVKSRDEIHRILEKGIPGFENGLGKKCFETAEYYKDVLSNYPKLKKAIAIYHPDLQGPFDVAHLIWGSDIFLALYDCPELVHKLLALITETYKGWMKKWNALIGEDNKFTTHWNFYIKGGIMIRNDTPVMLSQKQYDEFVRPYDQLLLDEFGGCIHFCGNGSSFIQSMCENSKYLYGIHSSQPELNDVKSFIELTLSNKIAVLGLPQKYLTGDIKTGVIGKWGQS